MARALKIGPVQIEAGYLQSKRVIEDENFSIKDATAVIVAQTGMNGTSAADHVRLLTKMVEGETYTRTMSEAATRIYLSNIKRDFSAAIFRNALVATRQHLLYYRGLKNGGPSKGRFAILEALEQEIGLEPDAFAQFQKDVNDALDDTQGRRERLNKLSPMAKPRQKAILQMVYERNHDVVAERLSLAAGKCDKCEDPAPFHTDKRPYLEVHHRIPLSEGGLDVVENTVALCPNCHREAHFGVEKAKFRQ